NRVESMPCTSSSTNRAGQPWDKPGHDEGRNERSKGSGTPTDACLHLRIIRMRRALIGARSPVGVPPRLCAEGALVPPVLLQARLPGTKPQLHSLSGRYPPLPVPVQGSTSRAGHSTGRLMPKAARERIASPPAGTAHAPCSGVPREHVPTRARCPPCNRNSDYCHITFP